jgi:hypothetical protein
MAHAHRLRGQLIVADRVQPPPERRPDHGRAERQSQHHQHDPQLDEAVLGGDLAAEDGGKRYAGQPAGTPGHAGPAVKQLLRYQAEGQRGDDEVHPVRAQGRQG